MNNLVKINWYCKMTITINSKKIIKILLVNLVVLLCCFIALDVIFGLIHSPAKIVQNRAEGDHNEETHLPKHLLSPYFGWIDTPGTKLKDSLSRDRINRQSEYNKDPDWLYITNNNIGFISNLDIPFIKKENDILIVVLGGSVARWFALQASEVFTKQLQQNYFFKGKNIILLNAATGGYKQPQQVNVFTFLLINDVKPDIVLNIDGHNEATLSYSNMANKISPIYPSHSHWAHLTTGVNLSREIREIIMNYQGSIQSRDYYLSLIEKFSYSNILIYIFLNRSKYWNSKVNQYEQLYVKTIADSSNKSRELTIRGPIDDVNLDYIADIWLKSSKLIHDICSSNKIYYFHILQPTAHDPDRLKILSKAEKSLIGPKNHLRAAGIRQLYPLFKARAEELKQYGIRYKDLTDIFLKVEDTIYYDICHYNQKGNEIFAKSIAVHIISHLTDNP